jgi:MFS family permease
MGVSRRTRLVFVTGTLFLDYFLQYLSFALLAPFYPQRVQEMGVSKFLTGAVLACYPLSSFLFALFLGPRVKQFGHQRELMVLGMLLCGGASLGFASFELFPLVYEPHTAAPNNSSLPTATPWPPPVPLVPTLGRSWAFLLLSVLCRVGQGAGAALTNVLGSALLATELPDNVASVGALATTAAGLGYAVGPALGGVLYELGGWTLPFASTGASIGLVALVFWVVLGIPAAHETTASDSTKAIEESKLLDTLPDAPLFTMLLFPPVFAGCFAQVLSLGMLTFEDPIMGPLLSNPTGAYGGRTQTIVGLVFSIMAGAYLLVAVLTGLLSDALPRSKAPSLVAGLIFSGTGAMLLGPAPFLLQRPSIWFIVLGNTLVGTGCGLTGAPVFALLLEQSALHLAGRDLNARNTLSGLLSASFSIGGFVGPLISQPMVSWLGFAGAAAGLGYVLIGWGLVSLLAMALFLKRERALSLSERSPLLTN